MNGSRHSDLTRAKARQLILDGKTSAETATILNIPLRTIQGWVCNEFKTDPEFARVSAIKTEEQLEQIDAVIAKSVMVINKQLDRAIKTDAPIDLGKVNAIFGTFVDKKGILQSAVITNDAADRLKSVVEAFNSAVNPINPTVDK